MKFKKSWLSSSGVRFVFNIKKADIIYVAGPDSNSTYTGE